MNRPVRRAVICAIGLVLAAVAVGVSGAAPPLWGDRTANAGSMGAQQVGSPLKTFPLFARNASTGELRAYEANGTGGLKSAYELGGGFGDATALVQANVSEGGRANDLYHRAAGTLYYTAEHGNDTKVIGGGWDIYNTIVSVGNMGGTADPDLVGRDASGNLWLYQGKPDGTLAARIRVGTGWNGMTLVGRGDYTGDGKADLLARFGDGTLNIYAGTGAATVDAVVGTRYDAGAGWQAYKALASAGDTDGDGKTDLIAADTAGALWLFKGTGNTAAPFAPRVQIGASGWAAFDVLF
ncbi:MULTISPECIES: FG-GAP repeat domain-containing protein [Streptomyces]|uniref:FG-GAP repeat domain-containing protein n=1 Tax=Streptomyces TaxID=1883 RepID=UPI0021AFCC9C|nr:VCBS repeat-containing protein [Streptomyces sp. WAC05292]